MKIKYLAHSAFLITADNGTKIVTDPYTPGMGMKYGAIKETADIVTASHGHGDHNNVTAVKGNPQIVKTSGEVKGIKIKVVPAAHDDKNGSQRGANTVFCFEVDGVSVCHLGDLGHVLTAEQVKAIGKVDVLMVPVGGFFTIDAATAGKVCDQLKPKVILPMHYKTEKADFPIAGVDDFLKGKNNVTRSNDSEIEPKAGKLPAAAQIVVLKPAL
ncbi:MAG: MBL fold metallo-hydrolase [Dehalococcoidales bacterium]|jgi:L-ascorbate metabolism protein UlaG (beta-lactamase superfamily)